jgi:hypothetical protein
MTSATMDPRKAEGHESERTDPGNMTSAVAHRVALERSLDTFWTASLTSPTQISTLIIAKLSGKVTSTPITS